MKQVLIRSGQAVVEEVPAPQAGPREILVAVSHSCVSVGTEGAGMALSAMPLYRRALKQPQHVKRVLDIVREQGLAAAINRVKGQLEAGTPTGYSAAGTVVAMGDQVEGFAMGDPVACAGAGIANHAGVIAVPVNLAARIPDGLDASHACTVTLGAIALQGIRRANPTLSETMVVIGLGVLGLLTVQMLKANGIRVIGIDLDSKRRAIALGLGTTALDPAEDAPGAVHRLTDGFGADGVIICAASSSDSIVAQAAQCCRKKGRVVLVGDVGLSLNRADFYAKEIDFLISCSYGPGRYDPIFEQGGADYPLAYVRWTETRNMEAYLALLAQGSVRLEPLAPVSFPVEQASAAYASLKSGDQRPLLVLLSYPETTTPPTRRVTVTSARMACSEALGVGILGAGSFLQAVHIPNMMALTNRFHMRGVMSRTGSTAKAVASRTGAAYATTEVDEVLKDDRIGLVVIGTRHDLHGSLVLRALQAGKAVLVEKPLCLTEAELAGIENFYADHPQGPLLLTGFNRRFSPAALRLAELLQDRSTPIMASYRMNAGFLPADHWTQGPEGGGRNLGEACHVYDLFGALTGSLPVKVAAQGIRATGKQWRADDNFSASLTYADGSVCTLLYTALGTKDHPKERLEAFADGMVADLDDYRRLTVAGRKAKGWQGNQDKGHKALMAALADGLKTGIWPIPLDQQIAATRAALTIQRLISP